MMDTIKIPGKTEDVSDGYHTFGELYEHRHALFLALCSEGYGAKAWKSRLHDDGSGFDGWFIAGLELPTGKTITYHLPNRLWDKMVCNELTRSPKWDGHTSGDVVDRLLEWTDE